MKLLLRAGNRAVLKIIIENWASLLRVLRIALLNQAKDYLILKSYLKGYPQLLGNMPREHDGLTLSFIPVSFYSKEHSACTEIEAMLMAEFSAFIVLSRGNA